MLKDHKLRQEMFHKLEHTNDLLDAIPHEVVEYSSDADLVGDVISYFYQEQTAVQFPAKSYAVAIIYAALLERYFDIPLLTSLSNPDLLFGNDKYFVPYGTDSSVRVYHGVLNYLIRHRGFDFAHGPSQVRATVDYFEREFYINPNPYFDNADLS